MGMPLVDRKYKRAVYEGGIGLATNTWGARGHFVTFPPRDTEPSGADGGVRYWT